MEEDIANRWTLLKSGDKESFEYIYNRYYADLVSYANRFGDDPNFTDECIQDLFVKIWQNRAGLGDPNCVKFYLFKALKHIIYNKKNVSRKEMHIGLLTDFSPFDHYISDNPEHALSEEITTLLACLTDRQREAIYLFYYQDFGYKEIAKILHINISGAYKLIYRALDALKSEAILIRSFIGSCFFIGLQDIC